MNHQRLSLNDTGQGAPLVERRAEPRAPASSRTPMQRQMDVSYFLERMAGRLWKAHERRDWSIVKEMQEELKDRALRIGEN